MAANKVVFGGNTIIDLTGDNVTAADVTAGVLFHLPNGEQAVGTSSGSRTPSISDISYTGTMQVLEDNDDVWEVAFLTSGTLTVPNIIQIDAFLLGGGGGGGYTVNTTLTLAAGSYPIVIGNGGNANTDGEDTSAFSITANGGKKGGSSNTVSGIAGGAGGSGGGGGASSNGNTPGTGGSDGANGASGQTYRGPGGTGQGLSTRAYGEASNTLYAGGGGGGGSRNTAGSSSNGASGGNGGGANGGNVANKGSDAAVNTGGGGGGGGCRNATNTSPGAGGKGGSGIVRIRTHRVS